MFVSHEHCSAFSRLVAQALSSFPARAHAFCWMNNEARMIVQVAGGDVAGFVRHLAEVHADQAHATLCSAQCPFERHHWKAPIEAETELLDTLRHIHLAPVRAGLAGHPGDYPWSSDQAYRGKVTIPWLSTGLVQDVLADISQGADDAYELISHTWVSGQGYRAQPTQPQSSR
jgi:hypothetical protein